MGQSFNDFQYIFEQELNFIANVSISLENGAVRLLTQLKRKYMELKDLNALAMATKRTECISLNDFASKAQHIIEQKSVQSLR